MYGYIMILDYKMSAVAEYNNYLQLITHVDTDPGGSDKVHVNRRGVQRLLT